ncbi:MAG: peptidase [Puniceicoccaceae bacterium]
MAERNTEVTRIMHGLKAQVAGIREVMLANAVMIGEIPAPSFQEERRIAFLRDRFTEAGLEKISIDEMDNAVAVIPGRSGKRKILVSANADSYIQSSVDHAMTLSSDAIIGPGICDNAIGLAAIATLPVLMERLGLQLEDDLVLMAETRSLGKGNLAGLRFFLDHTQFPIRTGVVVRGVHLGRLSYSSLGMFRGEISVVAPERRDWKHFGSGGAIAILNRIVSRIMEIPLPSQPKTAVILGSIHGGNAYNTEATRANLRFEVRSEEPGRISWITQMIQDIVDEIDFASDSTIRLEMVARRKMGGIHYSHPLVKTVKTIVEHFGIKPRIAPSTGQLSAFVDKGIPAVTVGLTQGSNVHELGESAEIAPIFDGLTQLVALLIAIDRGICDED